MDFSKINLADNQELARLIVKKAISENLKDRRSFEKLRNRIIKSSSGAIFHNLYFVKAYQDLLREGEIEPSPNFLKFIQKRGIRTLSGVTPVTVMTKPFPCPGRCVYCPTDVRMPKSYLASQPAAQRAFRQRFHPYTQVFVRLKALHMTGHEISKVELRVIGGTWSSYGKRYQTWFIKQCLLAMNDFWDQISDGKADDLSKITKQNIVESKYGSERINTVVLRSLGGGGRSTFAETVKKNETAKVRCIGINIETRPDFINKSEIRRLRRLGVTKIEIGVQTTNDEVQKLTKRGHDLLSVRKATNLLKDAGFKIGYHMMPNLPGATVDGDKKMIGELFSGNEYQPDYLKIYPCVVIPGTELSESYRQGAYHPYDDKTLEEVLYEELKSVPYWCRVDRVARDIPANEIEVGFKMSNIRQFLEDKMRKEKVAFKDIRTREIMDLPMSPKDVSFHLREYNANNGVELFLSYEDDRQDKLIALLRLRFPSKAFLRELKGAAIIREVHVYGKQIPVGIIGSDNEKQHVGWGSKLMHDAEDLAKNKGYKKVAVIAGIGTREYYRKKGYELKGSYMVKELV